MASTILRKSSLVFEKQSTVLDLSCYAIAFEIVPSTEEIDIGTFCAPSKSAVGRTTYTASATLLWEPALYTALQPWIGAPDVEVRFAPDSTKPLECVKFDTSYAAQPWGRFEVGQRVEVELPLAVLSTPVWSTTGMQTLPAPERDTPEQLPEGELSAETPPAETPPEAV